MSNKPALTDPRYIKAPPLPAVVAIKAIATGTATEDQQRRFMEFLITQVCGYHECHAYFGDGGADKSQFAMGRARVAQYLMTYIAADIRKFKDGQPSEQVT